MEHVDGTDKGRVVLYALSTCGWCKKTKALLTELGIAFDVEHVDKLLGEIRENTIKDVEKWNPRCSFPTLVIRDDICIVGFKEDEIKEAFGV